MNILAIDMGQALRRLLSRVRRNPRKPQPVKDPERVKDLLKQSPLFAQLSDENLVDMIGHMERVRRIRGDEVIREGDDGNFYYMLIKGRAVVTRRGDGGKPQVLADLEDGAVFGEEALISYRKRNASVAMESDGELLRLSKDAFIDYLQRALVDWLSPLEAQQQVNSGAKWLDVTQSSKSRRDHLPGAISMPLDEVRDRAQKLKKDLSYVCYCENGRRSATAAFLLRQEGLQARVLRGGLRALSR